jgi:hypothetical protein
MDDKTFFALAAHINKLVTGYQSGVHKHHIYVAEYDKLLENHGVTKKQWVDEIKKRSKAKLQSVR